MLHSTDMPELHRRLVDQLREFVAAAGFDDVVVAVSGGIDSAVRESLERLVVS